MLDELGLMFLDAWGGVKNHVDARLARVVSLGVSRALPSRGVEAAVSINQFGGAGGHLSHEPVPRGAAAHVVPIKGGRDHGVKISFQIVGQVLYKEGLERLLYCSAEPIRLGP